MAKLSIRPLSDDLPYGSRIGGVTWDTVRDEALRQLSSLMSQGTQPGTQLV